MKQESIGGNQKRGFRVKGLGFILVVIIHSKYLMTEMAFVGLALIGMIGKDIVVFRFIIECI
jgi:hypothetical protein